MPTKKMPAPDVLTERKAELLIKNILAACAEPNAMHQGTFYWLWYKRGFQFYTESEMQEAMRRDGQLAYDVLRFADLNIHPSEPVNALPTNLMREQAKVLFVALRLRVAAQFPAAMARWAADQQSWVTVPDED